MKSFLRNLALFLTSVLISVPNKTAAADPLDLFVFERHRNFVNSNVFCDCNDEIEGCVIASRRFFIEEDCFADSRTNDQGEELFLQRRAVDANGEFCTDEYTDASCTNLSRSCRFRDVLDTCYGDNFEFTRLEDWCIRSAQPQEDYIVPIAKVMLYNSMEDCSQNVGALDFLLPIDPQLCQAISTGTVDSDDIIPGGMVTTCQESQGKTKIVQQLFSNLMCDDVSVENTAVIPSREFVADECTALPNRYSKSMGCGEGEPLYHCKSLDDASFIATVFPEPTASPTPAPTSNPTVGSTAIPTKAPSPPSSARAMVSAMTTWMLWMVMGVLVECL